MWFEFEELSSLTSMWSIMVHTWNIFFGVKQAGEKNVPLQHSNYTLMILRGIY